MTAATAALDHSELIHLALEADRNGDSGASLAYLKQAVSRPDATAPAHLLLGAGYAQLQMYDRAVTEMESALALDPSLAIARFQLGLLLLTCGDALRALDTLKPLAELGEAHALAQFGAGLIHLIGDEFGPSIACLHKGIALNTDNPALNQDMLKIIEKIEALPPQAPAAESGAASDDSARHIFLSAYTTGAKQ